MQPFDPSKAAALFGAVMDSVRSFECVKEQTQTFGLYNYSAHRAILRRSLAPRSIVSSRLMATGLTPMAAQPDRLVVFI